MMSVDDMKPGRMVAVGDMLMASFPLQHELMWTIDGMAVDEEISAARAYCRCGWVNVPDQSAASSRAQFLNHLLELQ